MKKKTLIASEQKREDVVEQRKEWQQIQEDFDITSLFGKQVLYPFDVFLCPFHQRSLTE